MRRSDIGVRSSIAGLLRVVVIAALVVVPVILAPPAGASTTSASAPVRVCTNLNDLSCKATYTSIAKNLTVTMRCWEDGPVKYAGTVRFFWIKGPGGVEGYVSANHVSANTQTTVGHCDKVPYVKALRWAGSKLGEETYVNLCLKYVRDAWAKGGKDIGSAPSAITYWNTNPKGYTKGTTTNPAAGYPVFWKTDSYNADGHAALSLGGGYVISTYERSTKAVHVFKIADRNKTKPYAGWMKVR